MDIKPAVQTKNIVKKYVVGDSEIFAINDITLEIMQGEFVAIVGKSGSGKSTLMHMLGLLDTPTSGDIFLNSQKASNLKERDLALLRNKEIGFVFQAFNLLPRASSLENVMLPLQYSTIPRGEWLKKSMDVLNMVELGDRINNKSNELSGGQKQRVAIARALVNNPSIILADEPTGNLDTKTSVEIENVFKNLNSQGKTIILVTHDDELAEIAKRKIIIRDGRIVDDIKVS